MRRSLSIVLLLASAACRSHVVEEPVAVTPSPIPLAAVNGPRPAVDAFMSAIKAQDLQALSAAWGDKTGSVRDNGVIARAELEQRELVLIRCFRNDGYRILGDSPAADGERAVQLELTRGTATRVVDFLTTRGPDRWYVRHANVADLCAAK